jgi:hypothetical protein
MTGMDYRSEQQLLKDAATIASAINFFTEDSGFTWDTYNAAERVPAWSEARQPHSETELFRTNVRALAVSDALIINGFCNGSAMTGWLEGLVLPGCRHVPVLVIAGVNEVLSKAWRGQSAHYTNIAFEIFHPSGEDYEWNLHERVLQWLRANGEEINQGPRSRRVLEDLWAPQAAAILKAWNETDDEIREMVQVAVGLTEVGIRDHLDEPLLLASLPIQRFGQLLFSLRADVERVGAIESARAILTADELTAWVRWSARFGDDYAWSVLMAAVRERQAQAVAREASFLGQPGGWDRFARDWRTGAVG